MNKLSKQVLILGISIGLIFIITTIAITLIDVYGSAIEDEGKTLNEKLLDRAREWNIKNTMNETLLVTDRFACFNNLNDYFEFRLENENYSVESPCPEFDIRKLPEDESNR